MRNPIPFSVRLETETEQAIAQIAARAGIKKATLVVILLDAAIAALDTKGDISLPVRFKLVQRPKA